MFFILFYILLQDKLSMKVKITNTLWLYIYFYLLDSGQCITYKFLLLFIIDLLFVKTTLAPVVKKKNKIKNRSSNNLLNIHVFLQIMITHYNILY